MRERQYFAVPHLFLQESSYSSAILLKFHWNMNGIKQTKVEILIYSSQFLKLCRSMHFSLLGLPFLHHVYSNTLPLLYPQSSILNSTLFVKLVNKNVLNDTT